MKLIHTSDWHIGKLVHGLHMTEDQEYILDQLLEIIRLEKPQVLIISGDIYDRSVPPTEAIKLLDKTIGKILIENECKVIMIAGNHDNPDRLSFASELLKGQGLYIVSSIEHALEPIIMEDENGEVAFYTIPYLEPSIVKHFYQDQNIKTHQDALEKILDDLKDSLSNERRNVVIYHGFVKGLGDVETSDSERQLSIGGSEVVDVMLFKDFDYVALGHLHGPQKVQFPHIRYAGSLLKYSFSEHLHKKGITLINLLKENIEIEEIKLSPRRDMRRIKGSLDDLIDYAESEGRDDYIEAILTDRGELIDAIGKLRSVYPNILSLTRENSYMLQSENTSASKEFNKMHPTDLFYEFFENITGESLPDGGKEIIEETYIEIEKERRRN
jgi:exonuclease SbcD